MTAVPPPLVVRRGEGELIDVGGIRHLFALTADHTGGRFGLEEFTLPPTAHGARPHVHGSHDEYFRDVHAAVAAGDEPTDELLASLRSRYDTTSG